MNIEREEVEKIVRQILTEKLGTYKTSTADGLMMVDIPDLEVSEQDRMDTGNANDRVY